MLKMSADKTEEKWLPDGSWLWTWKGCAEYGRRYLPDDDHIIQCRHSSRTYRCKQKISFHDRQLRIEPALDATVDYKSGLDFTFTNTLNYPIYIESYVDGDSVTVNIWGVEERAANRTIYLRYTRTTDFVWKDPLYVQRVDDVNCKAVM